MVADTNGVVQRLGKYLTKQKRSNQRVYKDGGWGIAEDASRDKHTTDKKNNINNI